PYRRAVRAVESDRGRLQALGAGGRAGDGHLAHRGGDARVGDRTAGAARGGRRRLNEGDAAMQLTNAERWLRRVLRISGFIFTGETLVYLLPALICSSTG